MAEQNITPVQHKVDQLRECLWRATPAELGNFLDRHDGRLLPCEVECIRFAYRAAHCSSAEEYQTEESMQLSDEWGDFYARLLESDALATERANELADMADIVVCVCCG